MNLDKIYKTNKEILIPKIRESLIKDWGDRNIFLAGNGITLTYPSKKSKTIDNYVTFCLSQKEIKNILKDSNVIIKNTMSKKVDIVVWDNHSYYTNDYFKDYLFQYVTWVEFLQPIVDILTKEFEEGNLK